MSYKLGIISFSAILASLLTFSWPFCPASAHWCATALRTYYSRGCAALFSSMLGRVQN
jgi:hypothetical protein